MLSAEDLVDIQPIKEVPFLGEKVDVVEVNWNQKQARISLSVPSGRGYLEVVFDNQYGPCSLRILDESELEEFWSFVSLRDGWLYKIVSGGWMDLESQRSTFSLQHAKHIYAEYLIVGIDACVSVLSKQEPIINEGST